MKFKIIYPFEVLDLISKGYEVSILDRKENFVTSANEMRTFALMRTIKANDTDRYEYWYVTGEDEE